MQGVKIQRVRQADNQSDSSGEWYLELRREGDREKRMNQDI